MLINTFGDNNVCIARCLFTANLDKLKNLRSECSCLNTSSAIVANGKNKFLVINQRIMERLQNGTLISFTLPSPGGMANTSKVQSYNSNITSGNKQQAVTSSSFPILVTNTEFHNPSKNA